MKKEWPSVGEKKSRAVMDTAFFNRFIPGTGLRPGAWTGFRQIPDRQRANRSRPVPGTTNISPFAGPGGQPGSGVKSVPESRTHGELAHEQSKPKTK